jgi:integrase
MLHLLDCRYASNTIDNYLTGLTHFAHWISLCNIDVKGIDETLIEVSDGTPFFIGARGRRLGRPLGRGQVHRVFIGLREQLGWINRGAHNAPRIHDLRHTFVVRRVLLWQAQGLDVDRQMLALSTYVGHAMVTNTCWYLTGIPQLMAVAAERFENFTHMPEVCHD